MLAATPLYDHCNFTVLDGAPRDLVERFRSLLLGMRYDDPAVRPLLGAGEALAGPRLIGLLFGPRLSDESAYFYRAMQRALEGLSPRPEHVLMDARQVKAFAVPQTPIVKGDATVQAISAASILAKVARDLFCEQMHESHPHYGFATHKGYGTAEHLAALRTHGASPWHRRSFAPVREVGTRTLPDPSA